ncbi:unnamed protein product [Rotaria socialis]|uniref:Uncharacterized protein n=1 Tax=Rotaria socialis TaxID=392032 RepID=A0A817QTF5_9BILA|nr:unnamed protein product [Rotaria socialis]CAF3352275.1 unnamed protein product [Rotaria socialis]CAF3513936.1 unnamed protein product [Rotaria socialis]CAF3631750.1 unnamed protein product [Rotaria socialis]CAF3805139.1 unnamed protein product [Rotaria socialis]
MQYEQTNEKVTVMDGLPVAVTGPLSLTEDPQIQRFRKYLLILLGVFLAPCLITTIMLILTQVSSSNDQVGTGTRLSSSVVSVIFYSFGILVAYRYSTTGLRVFAWLSIVLTILAGFGISIFLFLVKAISASSSDTGNNKSSGFIVAGSIGIIIDVIIFTAAFGLTILIIVLAFKLSRLIAAKTSLATQQI